MSVYRVTIYNDEYLVEAATAVKAIRLASRLARKDGTKSPKVYKCELIGTLSR